VIALSTFGSDTDPAVLLIGGSGASMDWWAPEFCARLAAGGRFVIRYDHRDTGESVSYPPGEPGYTGADLVSDAVAVLDKVGVAAAHVVGISMGGAIAQQVALAWPDRVLSLALMSTSGGPGDADLPGSSPELASAFETMVEPDWTDDDAVVEYLVAGQRVLSAEPYDADEIRAIARTAVSRTTNNESSQKNHHAAPDTGESWRHRLPSITVPTVVFHGDKDPLFQLPHGKALAAEIQNARLVVLANTGHEFPARNWPTVLKELPRH
jgi:pimeloyl-ACP methyl ester carboxylesterase